MDALVTAFVVAALAEWGDKTQLLVALLAARSGRPGAVLAGLFLAALASCVLAAAAGVFVADTITIRAMTLMVALALLFAGISGLFGRKRPTAGGSLRFLIPAAAILCLAAEMGDRTQFLAFALAGRFDSPALAAAGATAGIVAACVPAALLGDRLGAVLPVKAIRYAGAGLFLVSGFVVAMSALRLI